MAERLRAWWAGRANDPPVLQRDEKSQHGFFAQQQKMCHAAQPSMPPALWPVQRHGGTPPP
eukprot:3610456-Lingulodinium_polyedra.AAC.1